MYNIHPQELLALLQLFVYGLSIKYVTLQKERWIRESVTVCDGEGYKDYVWRHTYFDCYHAFNKIILNIAFDCDV